jgi:hypothetical protein
MDKRETIFPKEKAMKFQTTGKSFVNSTPHKNVVDLKTYIKRKGDDRMTETKEKEIKLERLDFAGINRLYDIFSSDSWALRAFGALLETADLGRHFGNEHVDGAEYRWGLNQIVEMYLEKQERKLNEIQMKHSNSPEVFIKDALMTYEMVSAGAFNSHEVSLESVRKAINKLNLVISEFGLDEYPQAGKARDNLLSLQDAILKKMVPGKGKKAKAG